MSQRSSFRFVTHFVCVGAFLAFWEFSSSRGFIDPMFFGHPSGIVDYLWRGFITEGKLWLELAYTLFGAAIAFSAGGAAAVTVGLLFMVIPRLHHAAEPYLTLVNAMPRIALAPLFLLWFGLGVGSKIAVGFSLTFFSASLSVSYCDHSWHSRRQR
jgi:NitT/TauT family transport system permease protein